MKENSKLAPNSVWKTLPQYLAEEVAGWDRVNGHHHKLPVWPSINKNALRIGARQRTGFPDTLAVTVERSEAAILVKIDTIGVLQIFPILDNGKCRVTLRRETSRLELPEMSRRILSLAGFY